MEAIDLNMELQGHGTRFRVYPQSPVLRSVTSPETIWVSPPPGAVSAGPADEQMYVADALDKRVPYGDGDSFPPYEGVIHDPPQPSEEGHFDHLQPGTRQFEAAHVYAVIRRVLDVWECYLGHPVVWHFSDMFDRLELIPYINWDNAQSGYGYIELGFSINKHGEPQLYCLNFDILAHELGHSIIYSVVGQPHSEAVTSEYFGFHETAADMTALTAALHFNSVVDRLLRDTSGNLYSLNELNRFAEISENDQVRVACNRKRMSDYAAGWYKEHDLSQPLTGALFDILIEVFHLNLIKNKLIGKHLAEAAYDSIEPGVDTDLLQHHFNQAYAGHHALFKSALLDARDYFGILLANCWSRLSANNLTYIDVYHALLDADQEITNGQYQSQIIECFRWREIGDIEPGPKLSRDSPDGTFGCR